MECKGLFWQMDKASQLSTFENSINWRHRQSTSHSSYSIKSIEFWFLYFLRRSLVPFTFRRVNWNKILTFIKHWKYNFFHLALFGMFLYSVHSALVPITEIQHMKQLFTLTLKIVIKCFLINGSKELCLIFLYKNKTPAWFRQVAMD